MKQQWTQQNKKTIEEWTQIQNTLRELMVEEDPIEFNLNSISLIGSLDVSFTEPEGKNGIACYVVMTYPDCKIVYKNFEPFETENPFISGFLAFREYEKMLDMVTIQREEDPDATPDVLMIDGGGKWHYRLFGLACQVGVLVGDIPTIGVAKKMMLVDGLVRGDEKKFMKKIPNKGEYEIYKKPNTKEIYGAVYNSGSKHPIYISVGNNISLDSAIKIVKAVNKHRIPEPTRQADLLSRDYIRNMKK